MSYSMKMYYYFPKILNRYTRACAQSYTKSIIYPDKRGLINLFAELFAKRSRFRLLTLFTHHVTRRISVQLVIVALYLFITALIRYLVPAVCLEQGQRGPASGEASEQLTSTPRLLPICPLPPSHPCCQETVSQISTPYTQHSLTNSSLMICCVKWIVMSALNDLLKRTKLTFSNNLTRKVCDTFTLLSSIHLSDASKHRPRIQVMTYIRLQPFCPCRSRNISIKTVQGFRQLYRRVFITKLWKN